MVIIKQIINCRQRTLILDCKFAEHSIVYHHAQLSSIFFDEEECRTIAQCRWPDHLLLLQEVC